MMACMAYAAEDAADSAGGMIAPSLTLFRYLWGTTSFLRL